MATKPYYSILSEFVDSQENTISFNAECNPEERADLIQQCQQRNLDIQISAQDSVVTIAKKNFPNVLPLKITKSAHNSMRNFCFRSQYHAHNKSCHVSTRPGRYYNIHAERALRGSKLSAFVGVVQIALKYDESREFLPSFPHRKTILELIKRERIVIFSGDSGTGKTTQIPQYIMDDNIDCEMKIVCVEPDHIATVQAAEIVAKQRGEKVGFLVGYHVQLESKTSPHNCLVYCTPDVFIQTLVNNPTILGTINYLIIDEIHLRNRYVDFTLVTLKEYLEMYPNLKLILLSATRNVDIYKNYFYNCEILDIPTQAYSVQEFFVEDILEIVNYESNEMMEVMLDLDGVILRCMEHGRNENFMELYNAIVTGKMDVNYQERVYGYTPLMVAAARGNVGFVKVLLDIGGDVSVRAWNGYGAFWYSVVNCQFSAAKLIENTPNGPVNRSSTSNIIQKIYHQTVTDDVVDYNLILEIIKHVQSQSWDNLTMMVFLPSYDHIIDCINFVAASPIVAELKVLSLHKDMLPHSDHELFQPCKERKVVFTTVIAESSFYVPDVGYVIDCGRISPSENCVSSSSLISLKWISQLAAHQRKAKLAFQSNGKCFRLYSKERYDTFNFANTSELFDCHLEDLCLRANVMVPHLTTEEYFDKLVEPPPTGSVKKAIKNLKLLGVIDSQQNLTDLGQNVVQFFVEPYIAKLLIYGVFLKCLDPCLTLAAILSYKNFFIETSDDEKLKVVQRIIQELSDSSKSDHMALIIALMRFQKFKCERMAEAKCKEYCILHGIAESVLVTRSYLLTQLRALGFIFNGYRDNIKEVNSFSECFSMVKAALTASLYPRLALRCGSAFRARNKLVASHPTSCISTNSHRSLPLGFIYQRTSKSNDTRMIKCITAVTPLTIALFCGSNVSFDVTTQTLTLDKHTIIEIHSNMVWRFRIELNRYLERFFKNPLIRPLAIEETFLNTLFRVLNVEETEHKLIQPSGIGRKPLFISLKTTQYTTPRYTDDYIADPVDDDFKLASNAAYTPLNPSMREGASTSTGRQNDFGECKKMERNKIKSPETSIKNQIVNEYFRMTYAKQTWGVSSGAYNNGETSKFKFYVIRPLEKKNIVISLQQNLWKFTAQTEKKIFAKFLIGDTVILLYNIRGTDSFQAVAHLKNTHIVNSLSCPIQWLGQIDVKYSDIPNLNTATPYILEDGHEFSYEIGLEIAYRIIYGENDKTH